MKVNIARALRDAKYRNSLSEQEKAQLPKNPVGDIELLDDELADVAGGSVFTIIGGSDNTSGGEGNSCDTSQNVTFCSINDTSTNSTDA